METSKYRPSITGMELRDLITERRIPPALSQAPGDDPFARGRESMLLLCAAIEARSIRPPIDVGGLQLTETSELKLAGSGVLANLRAEQLPLPQPEV